MMTSNIRKYDENINVYIPPEIDTWYQLKFDHNSGYLVVIHQDRNEPLVKNSKENYYQMRRVIQRASRYSRNDEPSTIYLVLDKVLNNYKDLREIKQSKDYEYVRTYSQPKSAKRDLTDVANHLKRTGMPESFIDYFFHVENSELVVRPVVTQADIDDNRLPFAAMEEYVWSLKQLEEMPNFKSKKEDGWYPEGKPPIFKKYKKNQKSF